jgi:hypothetical protein
MSSFQNCAQVRQGFELTVSAVDLLGQKDPIFKIYLKNRLDRPITDRFSERFLSFLLMPIGQVQGAGYQFYPLSHRVRESNFGASAVDCTCRTVEVN